MLKVVTELMGYISSLIYDCSSQIKIFSFFVLMLSTYPPFKLNAFDTTGPSITVCVLSNLLAIDRFISKLYCIYYVYKFVVNRNDSNGSHAR